MVAVRVPQKDGTIQISRAGDPAETFEVKDSVTQVPEEHVDGFLRQIPGSQVVVAEPAKKKEA